METGTTKNCSRCGAEKPLTEFKPHKRGRDGRGPYCRECHNKASITSRRKTRSGVDAETYDRLYAEQGGRCAICEDQHPTLCADHCHTTGKPRRLLCHRCNRALGFMADSPERLERAAAYLRSWKDEHSNSRTAA